MKINKTFYYLVMVLVIMIGFALFVGVAMSNVWLFTEFFAMTQHSVLNIINAIIVCLIDVALSVFLFTNAAAIAGPDDCTDME